MQSDAERYLADSIVYLCSLLADRPRGIDRYLDYFGETPRHAADAGTRSTRPTARANDTKFFSCDDADEELRATSKTAG